MRMFRVTLAWLLALSLALGTWAPLAAAGCTASETSPATTSPAGGDCGTCDGADGKGQAHQRCPSVFCSAACISGPVAPAAAAHRVPHEISARQSIGQPHDALVARATPPDDPPPR
jgi:hypothetical protein